MPKNTFIKLKKEKKEKITNAFLLAFATQSYAEVTTNKLVECAQIPKGSFYQYFEDKNDLYFYLLDLVQANKNQYLTEIQGDFFEFWEHKALQTLQYEWLHTTEWAFWIKAQSSDYQEIGNLKDLLIQQNAQQMTPILRKEIRNETLSKHLSFEIQGFFIGQMQQNCLDYIRIKYAPNLSEIVSKNLAMPLFPLNEVKQIIRDWAILMRNGIYGSNMLSN